MTYSVISKALVIGSLLVSAYSSVSLAGQDLNDPKAVEVHGDTQVITVEQQREWEMTMLSWQQNLTASLQENRENMLLINDVDYQQDAGEVSVELDAAQKRIVQN